jgi:pyridoxine kinase
VPHVVVTSTDLPPAAGAADEAETLSLFGSTARSNDTPRLFRIDAPRFAAQFTGTGDMFAALLTGFLRAQAARAGVLARRAWLSDDAVRPADLPLARAAELAVAAVQAVLRRTVRRYHECEARLQDAPLVSDVQRKVRLMDALELKVVGAVEEFVYPKGVEQFRASEVKEAL